MKRFFLFAVLLLLIHTPSYSAQSESCEIIEGWVTLWISKMHQYRNEIVEYKIKKHEVPEDLNEKFAYSEAEHMRYRDEFESRCGDQGLQLGQ